MGIVFRETYGVFIKKNLGVVIAMLLIILIIFPLEAIYIPKKLRTVFSASSSHYNSTLIIVVSLFAVIILFHSIVRAMAGTLIMGDFEKHMRKHIFNNILTNSEEDYKTIKSGENLVRITNYSKHASYNFRDAFKQIIPYTVGVFSVGIFIFTQNKKMALYYFIGLLVILALSIYPSMSIFKLGKEREEKVLSHHEKMGQVMNNVKDIHILDDTKNTKTHIDEMNTQHTNIWKTMTYWQVGLDTTTRVGMLVAFAMVFAVGVLEIKKDRLDAKQFGLIILMILLAMKWMNELGDGAGRFLYRLGANYASHDFLKDIFSRRFAENRHIRSGIRSGKISFKGVTMKIGDKSIFDNLNWAIEPKQTVVLTGPNGIGKSLSMQLLVQVYTPVGGKITIDNLDISRIDRSYLRQKVVYSNQDTNLLGDTILKNILYTNDTKTVQDVNRLLTAYNLAFSKNLDTPVDVEGKNISGGDRRLITILRTLLKKDDAAIFIFDEPLAALEVARKEAVWDMIRQETAGKTVVVVSHTDTILTTCTDNCRMVNFTNLIAT
jgi:ABC-type multidrug transport system fused ATPase/permease subunit